MKLDYLLRNQELKVWVLKVEGNSDIQMISVNREDLEDLTVKVGAKLDDKPFLSYEFLKFLENLYYGHPPVGNSARICDVIVENSPLVMYIDVHKISFL